MAAPLHVSPQLQVRFTNTRGAAVFLGTTEKAIYRLVDKRAIPFIKVGKSLKFDLRRLEGWLHRREVSA